jgi:hypothetical protein
MSYVIENAYKGFWTGSKWSKEYPDAKLFRTKAEAEAEKRKAGIIGAVTK